MSTSEVKTQSEAKQHFPLSTIKEGLLAVGNALELPDDQIGMIILIVTASQEQQVKSLSWEGWLETAELVAFSSQNQQKIMKMVIALAFLRELGRKNLVASRDEMDQVWGLVRDALQCTHLSWKMMRSSDGSHAIPLWSLIKDGRIHELIRLHVWLPEKERGDADFAVHAHQAFEQSWVLAGESIDQTFYTTPAREKNATHAEYTVSWRATEEEKSGRAYEVHSISSTVTNTEKLVRLVPKVSELHSRSTNYNIPAGVAHRIDVESDTVHAKIIFFDSSRGYEHNAPVFGPISKKAYTNDRKATNSTPGEVVSLIEDLRNWEDLQDTGVGHSERGEWEEALRSYRTALHICLNNKWLDRPQYRYITLGRIGKMYRMLGRNEKACECLEQTVNGLPQSRFRVEFAGELAMIYRHMNRLEDSKRAAEEQYHDAKQLNLGKFACRAIGNVGMVNYQLYLLDKDEARLHSAISQLNERIERAQQIKDVVLEAIGYSRLSLCYIAKGDSEKAIQAAQKNYDLTCMQPDQTKIGFAKVFLGRALLFANRKDEALAVFNQSGGCSPIIALCNEISSEHRQYIIEMISAGADLTLRDQHGYSALECTVYNGDDETTKIIEDGLREQISRESGNIENQLIQLRYEATLRKGYRDVFQDKLRPILLNANKDPVESSLRTLRSTYAGTLADDPEKRTIFDGLKYVRLDEFLRSGQLPRSNDGFTQDYADRKGSVQEPFIIFMSYRWIAKLPNAPTITFSPDDV